MTQFRFVNLAFSIIVAATTVLSGQALAGEHRAYFSPNRDPRLPDCTSALVRSAVAGSVARAQNSYVDGRAITGIDQIREVAYREHDVSPLARRFCSGTATLTDGSTRQVHYKLVEHSGFVGLGWKVEACMSALDKWHVYGAHCSTTRPR
ncbi:MAG: cytoplasmic protein [Roseibium sp.]